MIRHKSAAVLQAVVQPVAAILLGLVFGAVLIAAVGGSVMETYAEMWKGAFGNLFFTSNTFARATPIILIGLGVSLAFRAGFFNLGAEGQIVLGALAAASAALYLPGPAPVRLIAAIASGMAAGGLWSAFAGWLDARFRLNLLITTLLMNYIAVLFAGYMVSFPLKEQGGSGAAQTAMIAKELWLPKLVSGATVHAGFLAAVAAAVLLAVFLRSTVKGYEIRMTGSNPFFAMYGGVRRNRVMFLAMLASGALAGLAGAFEVLGTQYRYMDQMLTSPGYAWSGIMAALISGSNPIGTAVAALLLAALQTGGMGVERNTDIPLEISNIIQAALILFVSAKVTLSLFRLKKERAADGNPA